VTSREIEMAEAIQQIELDDANEAADTVYVRPKAPRSPAQVYSVRIPVDRIEELRVVAERQGKLPTALIREWVIERLDAASSAEPGHIVVNRGPGQPVNLELYVRRMEMQRGVA